MKPEIAEQWTAALRSGDYLQATGALHTVDAYTGEERRCCLGVLCDLAEDAGVPVKRQRTANGERFMYDMEEGVLPRSVQEWADLGTDNGRLPKDPQAPPFVIRALSSLNDEGTPFEAIADIIDLHVNDL